MLPGSRMRGRGLRTEPNSIRYIGPKRGVEGRVRAEERTELHSVHRLRACCGRTRAGSGYRNYPGSDTGACTKAAAMWWGRWRATAWNEYGECTTGMSAACAHPTVPLCRGEGCVRASAGRPGLHPAAFKSGGHSATLGNKRAVQGLTHAPGDKDDRRGRWAKEAPWAASWPTGCPVLSRRLYEQPPSGSPWARDLATDFAAGAAPACAGGDAVRHAVR